MTIFNKIAGIGIDSGYGSKAMICEMIDHFLTHSPFSHVCITEACIDKEDWKD
jgi:hypothetical protein